MSGPKFKNTKISPPKGRSAKSVQLNNAVQAKLEQAIGLHVNNQLDLAKPLYQEIIDIQPNQFDALHYLGVIHYQQGRYLEALDLIERAVKLMPSHSVSQSNLGNVYQSLNRYEEAIIAYTKSLELNPQFADAYFNLGVVFNSVGTLSRALQCYSNTLVLNPNMAFAYNNRALTRKTIFGRGEGTLLLEQICHDYERATQVNPNFAQAFFNWGVALHDHKELSLAMEKYDIAIKLDQNFAMALNNRGNLLQELGEFETALESFTKALQINPLFAEAHYNRGSLFQSQELYEKAQADYDCAIKLDSQMGVAFFNRGSVHEQLKNYSAAISDFERAIELSPEYANAHFNLSLLFLKLQRFEMGWEKYDWRWGSDDFLGSFYKTSKPIWHSKLKARTIFIWNEQGVGDEIFFLPWLPKFIDELNTNNVEKVRLICRVDKRLVELFRRSLHSDSADLEFVDGAGAPDDDSYEAHLPMGSLPLAVVHLEELSKLRKDKNELTYSAVANGAPPSIYLRADPKRVLEIRETIASEGELLIGISWKSKNSKTGSPRSLNLVHLVREMNLPNVRLVNLQYGDISSDLNELSLTDAGRVSGLEGLNVMQDLDGLASLITACDLVVSADNTTVHLSASLGKKTFILLPYTADWRWGVDSNKSIWYDHVELLRQETRGDWGTVLDRVREMVIQLKR